MQSFGNYNINPNPPVYVGEVEKRKKKKEEKPSEDIANKIALPIAITAGAALAICAGVFGVNKALGGGKKVVGKAAEETAGSVKETAKKANKTIQEQQQEISKILRNLQVGKTFTKTEATQLTQYLTTYTSALTLGGYQGINIGNYTKLINNFIKNINEKFKDPSVNEINIVEKGDSLIEDIGKINEMFDQIENLVKSQNQLHDANQMIEGIDIDVEDKKELDPVVPDPVAKLELTEGDYNQDSLLNGLDVQKLSSFDPQHIVCCYIEDIPFLVIDSNSLTLANPPRQTTPVKFDGAEANAYLYKLEDTMSPSDMITLLGNSKITSALASQISDNFLQLYLKNQAGKVSRATADELETMINLTQKVTETIKADESNEVIKAILKANTNLKNKVQRQQQLNEKLADFDADQDSSTLFKNFVNLKQIILNNYTFTANKTYYIDGNNKWTNNVKYVKFVISVGDDPQKDVTITKKAPYCDLVYDKDGHITVEATPAKKYIDIITAEKQDAASDLKCGISDDDKETALKNLKALLQYNDFLTKYKNIRGDKKYGEDFKPAGGGVFQNSSGGILTQLQRADLDTAINLLKSTKKNKDILSALNAATISTTYKNQGGLTNAIKSTQCLYLKDILTTNTTSKKLPLFSGDTQEEYITKIDGNTTVYTIPDGATPKEYTVTYDNSKNTVTIKLGDKTYTYAVSETECTLAENVSNENKDLFEYFVYMALPDGKKKAFASHLLKQIKLEDMIKTQNNQVIKETQALQRKVLRLIIAATDTEVQNAAKKILSYASSKTKKQDPTEQIYIDKKYNITKVKTKETQTGYIRIHIGGSPKRLFFTPMDIVKK